MRMEMTGQMRLEQRMKLAPHMIQSMEILQLPLLALQERIEQELNSNPVLELEEPEALEDAEEGQDDFDDDALAERAMVISTDSDRVEDFERLESLGNEFRDVIDPSGPMPSKGAGDEVDSKLQALKNTWCGLDPVSGHRWDCEVGAEDQRHGRRLRRSPAGRR